MNTWIPKSPEVEASADAVAKREAEYDRLAPGWRMQQNILYVIRGGSRYLERRPFDGIWTWGAPMIEYASKFTLSGAVLMLDRLKAAGVRDVTVRPTKEQLVTTEQILHGDISVLIHHERT